MCFSLKASVVAVAVEMTCLSYITVRAYYSKLQAVREQLLIIPLLCSVLIMEIIETILWWRSDELDSIYLSDSSRCASWNMNLTLVVWSVILPWQPFWIIHACRHSGYERNRDLLRVPEVLAFVFASCSVTLLALGRFLPGQSGKYVSVRSTGYSSYLNWQTCSYIGSHGNLQWTVRIPDSYMNPNAFTYFLLWSSVAFARPWRMFSGMAILLLISALILFAAKQGSWEFGSEWCYSAAYFYVWLVFQPYLFPCKEKNGEHNKKGEQK